MKRRFLVALVLVVVMGLVPVSAATQPPKNIIFDSSFVSALDVPFGRLAMKDDGLSQQWLWEWFSTPVNNFGIGEVTPEQLRSICSSLNNWFSRGTFSGLGSTSSAPETSILVEIALNGVFGAMTGGTVFAVTEHADYGEVIMMQTTSGWYYVCNSQGAFPYAPVTRDENGNRTLGGVWRPANVVDWERVNILTEFSLYDIAGALRDNDQDNDVETFFDTFGPKYQYIKSRWTKNGQYLVYCDKKGIPYVYRPDPSQWAQDTNQNIYTDDDGDGIYDEGPTENNKLLDLESNVIWFPDGTLQYIANAIYNDNTKTYEIDARQYDITNNTYVTNNYHYEYHINYTSVTYIGQTEEYNKVYEFYFELPDGRNSADLTEEELQALNVGVDVVPYIRSADTTALRSLYHFDGNLRDSSYWSYCTEFAWGQGASLTYMDVGEFNGALYLDENNHDFSIKLPSAIGITDFTLQFRLYHSATMAPQFDTFIIMNNAPVANFSGGTWGLGETGTAETASPGNWSEIALIRHDNTLRLYKNGLCVASTEDWTNYDDVIRFVFGSGQQTYKYLDELRVLDYALSKDGASYTPTAVPHDTNLTLVLPDSTIPVADEYWVFNADGNYFKTYDFTTPDISFVSTNTAGRMYFSVFGANAFDDKWAVRNDTSLVSVGYANGAWRFTHPGSYTRPTQSSSTSYDSEIDGDGYHFPLANYDDEDNKFISHPGLKMNGTYTFTVILRDGTSHSVVFTLPNNYRPSNKITYTELPDGSAISYRNQRVDDYTSCWLSIYPPSKGSVDIVYMELVEGSTPNTGHEFVSAIVPVDTNFRTPTLAVKTDLTITGYQIGGVRPSLPTKGLVWALVESSRISSLQIYNGQAWEQVDGRIWTGSRWVPYYAFDILLLKDMYDIIEGDPTLDPVYTQEGFWTWLQKAWGQMIDRLDAILVALGGDAPGNTDAPGGSPDASLPGGTDDPTTDANEGWQFIDFLVVLRDGTWAIVKGVINTATGGFSGFVDGVSTIGGFFDAFDPEAPGGVLDIMNEGGSAVWD